MNTYYLLFNCICLFFCLAHIKLGVISDNWYRVGAGCIGAGCFLAIMINEFEIFLIHLHKI